MLDEVEAGDAFATKEIILKRQAHRKRCQKNVIASYRIYPVEEVSGNFIAAGRKYEEVDILDKRKPPPFLAGV